MRNVVKPISKNLGFYNVRTQYFGTEYIKVTCCNKPIFNGDFLEPVNNENKPKISKDKNMDNPVLERSVSRAQDKVKQIAYSNDFTHFVTLTLDKSKVDRTDVDEVRKKLLNWLKHKAARNGLIYVLVPEYHEDNSSIHFHGLMSGKLDMIDSGTVAVSGFKRPMKLAKAKRLGLEGHTVYNLDNWHYGFTTAIELYGEKGACVNYFVKYITKDSKKIFGSFYLAGGRGLSRKVPTVYTNEDYQTFESQFESRLDEYKVGFKYRFDDGISFESVHSKPFTE